MACPKNGDCGCNCQQPFPDCFGCPVFALDIPQQWVMDLPSTMVYTGATSGSCSYSSPQSGKLNYTSSDIQYEYPDISAFGSSVPLDIDDAVRSSYYTPITECIWGSSGYKLFASIIGRVAPGGQVGCPLGAVEVATKESDISVPDCWYYATHNNVTLPPWFSQGRVRTTIIPANPACGVYTSGCFGSQPAPTCSVRAFGMWAVLRIFGGKLNVTVSWWPRGLFTGVIYDRLSIYSTFRILTGSSAWTNSLPQNDSPACFASMYPYATSTINILGPGSIVYEKVINCATDFAGSPVTLPRVSISKAQSTSTQNTFEAVGITGIPSSITITPV
jgi:hypothetical protein